MLGTWTRAEALDGLWLQKATGGDHQVVERRQFSVLNVMIGTKWCQGNYK